MHYVLKSSFSNKAWISLNVVFTMGSVKKMGRVDLTQVDMYLYVIFTVQLVLN